MVQHSIRGAMAKIGNIAGATIALVLLAGAAAPRLSADAQTSTAWPSRLDATFVEGGAARVVRVVDGTTVLLEGEVRVRLASVEPLPLAASAEGSRAGRAAQRARRALAALVEGERVRWMHGSRMRDRHGRVTAQLVRADGVWVQGALVLQGAVRVRSLPGDRAAAEDLLRLERIARGRGAGVWSDPGFAVRAAERAGDALNRFALVEGKVIAAATVRGRGYLNFGTDWTTDFTIGAAPGVVRLFARDGVQWTRYQGRSVRVRGWLYEFDGPRIDVTHPEQIEVLDTTR